MAVYNSILNLIMNVKDRRPDHNTGNYVPYSCEQCVGSLTSHKVIMMGWLYWQFAAMTVENRGNEHTWRMPANLMILYADRGDRRIKSPGVSLA